MLPKLVLNKVTIISKLLLLSPLSRLLEANDDEDYTQVREPKIAK